MQLRVLGAPFSPSFLFPSSVVHRRCISDARPFAVGDLVLLRQKLDRNAAPILTRPLQPGRRIESHKGIIQHDDIIGKRVRDIVCSATSKSNKAPTQFRLHQTTLEDYVRLTKRLVTPIYPADANLIVSLLDVHPSLTHEDHPEQKLHILEAGTGHGALTLYLSRAVHGVNFAAQSLHEDDHNDDEKLRRSRRAVIHTVDVSPKFSEHAHAVVKGFNHGIYAGNVDFHVGDVSAVVQKLQAQQNERKFLSYAFLDLPAANNHLASVADALRTDGMLLVFNPSITQITECAVKVKNERIPLDLERVVELGVNASSGGRDWDVRFVKPRRPNQMIHETSGCDDEATQSLGHQPNREESECCAPEPLDQDDWSMVCRPRVGDRIVGGGFLGVWRKHRDGG